jgi:hypothetical protein
MGSPEYCLRPVLVGKKGASEETPLIAELEI